MVVFYRRLPQFEYLCPNKLEDAVSLLEHHKGKAMAIAGGTDVVPRLKTREIKVPAYLINLKDIKGLDYIKYDSRRGLRIGALASISDVEQSSLIKEKFPVLAIAAASMASIQVRNRGTIAGNICSAVPSADSAPALLVLDAKVKLAGSAGEREIAIDRFFKGPRKTAIKNGEILTEIRIPARQAQFKGVYIKLSPRRAMDLAVVGVAVNASLQNGVCREIRIALGAVSPTPVRAKTAEKILTGQVVTAELIEHAAAAAALECHPISDHRAAAEYRTEMVVVLTRRTLRQILLGEQP